MPGRWWNNLINGRLRLSLKKSRSVFAEFFSKYFKCCFSAQVQSANNDDGEFQTEHTSYQVWIKVPPQIRVTLIQMMYGIATSPFTGKAITYGGHDMQFYITIRQFAEALILLDGCILDEFPSGTSGYAHVSPIERVVYDYMATLNWIRELFSMDVIHQVPAVKAPTDVSDTACPLPQSTRTIAPLIATAISPTSFRPVRSQSDVRVYLKNSPNTIHWMKRMASDVRTLDKFLPNQVPYLESSKLYPVKNKQILGSGSYAEVMLSRLGDSKGPLVAVKACFKSSSSGKFHRFIDKLTVSLEARVMLLLSQKSNVFPLVYGVCNSMTSDSNWGIVMEFIGDPTSCKSVSLLKAMNSAEPELSTNDGLNVALDVANGTKVIHENGLIHNDLATRNILLYNNGFRLAAKITDFGSVCTTSAPFDFFQLNDTKEEDRFDYMSDNPEHAPELFYPDTPPTFASDIYSLGVIIEAIGVNRIIFPLIDISGPCLNESPSCRPNIDTIISDLTFELNNNEIRNQT